MGTAALGCPGAQLCSFFLRGCHTLLRLKFSDKTFIFRQGHTFVINRLIPGASLFLESQIGLAGSPEIKRQIAARRFNIADKLRANVLFAVAEEAYPVAVQPYIVSNSGRLPGLTRNSQTMTNSGFLSFFLLMTNSARYSQGEAQGGAGLCSPALQANINSRLR